MTEIKVFKAAYEGIAEEEEQLRAELANRVLGGLAAVAIFGGRWR